MTLQFPWGVPDHAELPGFVAEPTMRGLPVGYRYGVTRYADVVLSGAFPDHWSDLLGALDALKITRSELEAGGGNRTDVAARFDDSLQVRGWGKRKIEIEKVIDGNPVMAVRGHEIDMFRANSASNDYPGVGCEMEWNNKDPFFDRDLTNFAALYREGVIAVGVIVTRGSDLQVALRKNIPGGSSKYGSSTTWWDKLIPRVNIGGGGECPLFLVGIETERVPDL
jgi:hypothetical protein